MKLLIVEDNMPKVIKRSVETNFKGWELKEDAKIVRNCKTTYEAELKKGEKKMDAIFTPDSNLVKKISEKESIEKDKANEE